MPALQNEEAGPFVPQGKLKRDTYKSPSTKVEKQIPNTVAKGATGSG